MLRVSWIRALLQGLVVAGIVLGCGNDSVTGPDFSAEEERITRQIKGSTFPECLAEFQRVAPTLQNLTPTQRIAELRRILALCFAPATQTTTGTLQVTTSTTGQNLDPDGYTVAVTGQTSQAVGINGSVSFPSLTAGNYDVTLQGLAANCAVTGGTNPRTVAVPAGGTGSTTFNVLCTAVDPGTASLQVTASTTGQNLDPDGYTVAVTGQTSQAVATNGSVTFQNLAGGDYQVELQGVAANCTVTAPNPRTVTVPSAGATSTTFDVTCTSTGPGLGIIVFTSDLSGSIEIYVMNADGSSVTPLTNNAAGEIHPRISTDGQRVVFASDADGDREIFIMDIDGSNVTQLTTNAVRDQEPRISPDGTQIVFERLTGGFDQVFVMNVNGTGQTQLTFAAANSGEPAWSPDGTQIVFTSNRLGGAELWVMNADGSSPVRLTNSTGQNGDGVWSGTQIVFESSRTGNFEIFVMNDDGTGQVAITNNPGVDSVDPAWSPDGTMLAFERNDDVLTMNADGTNVQNITNSTAIDTNPSWGPGSIP